MNLIERLKPSGRRSQYKIFRAIQYYHYLILSAIANWLITHVGINHLTTRHTPDSESRPKIIASLTTFPARINQVQYAIKSILLQTVLPDKIVLWLASDQFPDKKIPSGLSDLCNLGLEIRYCDDLRSHKKYYYALQEQGKDDIVITFDDDIIYHPRTIERLLQKHKEFPKNIICSQVHVMNFDYQGNILPYNQWNSYEKGMPNPNKDFMPLTGSGCLHPYNVMPSITFDKERIKRYAFTADDLWIGYIAKHFCIPICITDKCSRIFTVVKSSQTQHLAQINCLGDGNDETIRNLVAMFSHIGASGQCNSK